MRQFDEKPKYTVYDYFSDEVDAINALHVLWAAGYRAVGPIEDYGVWKVLTPGEGP